ncbi:MAG TPA: DUF4430 domain-containing protein [Candidatus Thermoplasmatota archaeon]|nr:DUF4430 domain-containing protein [Candidatus Thermoplasmatota archaeon]
MRSALAATLAATLAVLTVLSGCAGTGGSGAHSSLRLDFGALHPAVDADIAADLGSHPASALRKGHGVADPAAYTALDQLAQWAGGAGVPLNVSYSQSFGFFLSQVDGLPADPSSAFWSLAVDGSESQVGMDQVRIVDGLRIQWTLTHLAPAGGAMVQVASPIQTRADTVWVNGTSTPDARVTVVQAGAIDIVPSDRTTADASGQWSLQRRVEPGHTQFRVLAEGPSGSASADLTIIRLAQATVSVDYKGYPGSAPRSDKVWYDPDGNASAPMYAGKDLQHPQFATVHDLMVAWTNQTGTAVDYAYSSGLGFSVSKIAGVGSPLGGPTASLYWCYDYNGASASAGITGQQVRPGDTVAWKLGCV